MPSLRAYNNFLLGYYTYLEARFIKVIYIFVLYTIFSLYILYKVKPTLYNCWFFLFITLVV